MKETVSHYQTEAGIECIDAARAMLTPEEFKGAMKFNALKYLWRAGKKGPEIEDFIKAGDYVDYLIKK